MGCSCKVQKEITYFLDKYGDKRRVSKQTSLKAKSKTILEDIAIYLIMIPIAPLLFLMVVCRLIFAEDKKINISKVIRIASYGRKQQDA